MAIPLPNTQGQQGDNFLPNVPASQKIAPPRVDFDKDRFDTLVGQKGVDALIEKALQCPCKTRTINELSTCRNCGGTGWVFVNPRRSRVVLQSMSFENKEEVWTKIVHGIVKVTAPAEEQFSYLDRITRLNANSLFSEVIQFEEYDGTIYGWLSYAPKQIEYFGLFTDLDDPFQRVLESNLTIVDNRIEITGVSLPPFDDDNPLTATVRYVHAPVFHIIEHQREVVDNYRWSGQKNGEVLQYLPTLALARRAHDIEDLVNLRQGRLNDNSYDDSSCTPNNIYKPICNV